MVHSGDDLIVGHMSLEVDPDYIESGAIAADLERLGVPYRQNISVPDPKKSRENKFEASQGEVGAVAKATTGVVQFFIRDPDGYYIEICNCDRLTKFTMGEDDASCLENYDEGAPKIEKALSVTMKVPRFDSPRLVLSLFTAFFCAYRFLRQCAGSSGPNSKLLRELIKKAVTSKFTRPKRLIQRNYRI